jgi:hypothetical protein
MNKDGAVVIDAGYHPGGVGDVELSDQNRIDVWIDGGWGVDALLGEQTRAHRDLDIAGQHRDVPRLRASLEARGYKDVPRDDTRDCNFVLGDSLGHQIDVHSYAFDSAGNHVYGVEYPVESLTGTGSVNGHPVRRISPEVKMIASGPSNATASEGDDAGPFWRSVTILEDHTLRGIQNRYVLLQAICHNCRFHQFPLGAEVYSALRSLLIFMHPCE